MPWGKKEEPQLVKLARLFVARKNRIWAIEAMIGSLRNQIAQLQAAILKQEGIKTSEKSGLENLKVEIIKEMGGE